jgi:hypothetical protein
MSRSRSFWLTDRRKLRNDAPIFQASEAEIQSDLSRLKYAPKPEPSSPKLIVSIELPKKRKAPVEDNQTVIDGLIKLMSEKPPAVKPQPSSVVKKKPEPLKVTPSEAVNKPPEPVSKPPAQQAAWLNILALQNHYMKSMMLVPQYGMMPPLGFTLPRSSADLHLKLAHFTQVHKAATK